jgi:hypothetical protein
VWLRDATATGRSPSDAAGGPRHAKELAPLDRRVGAEGAADDFAQRLGAVDDEQPTDRRVEPARSDCRSAPGPRRYFRSPLDQAEGMPSMPRATTSTRSLPIWRPSIWMISRSSLDKSDAIHLASRSADSAPNRREDADFEVPSPAMIGRSRSGSRTARLSLRVDTLISIRFMAQRPSQSSACAAVQLWTAIIGSIRSLRSARSRASMRSSSVPASRLYPTTSDTRIASEFPGLGHDVPPGTTPDYHKDTFRTGQSGQKLRADGRFPGKADVARPHTRPARLIRSTASSRP